MLLLRRSRLRATQTARAWQAPDSGSETTAGDTGTRPAIGPGARVILQVEGCLDGERFRYDVIGEGEDSVEAMVDAARKIEDADFPDWPKGWTDQPGA